MPRSHFPSADDGLPAARTNFAPGQEYFSSSLPSPVLEPLVDWKVLRELEEDFDSPSVVRDFARDFTQSWEAKYRRLARFVQQRDQAGAKEAALSVKVTSTMVGAVRLAHLATWFEQLIENNDLDAAKRTLPCVEACGIDTTTELVETYISPEQ